MSVIINYKLTVGATTALMTAKALLYRENYLRKHIQNSFTFQIILGLKLLFRVLSTKKHLMKIRKHQQQHGQRQKATNNMNWF
jgi:hypothetical protein